MVTTKRNVSGECATLLNKLLAELASELDLHYEDDDMFALAPTMKVMKEAADVVLGGGFDLPEGYLHIVKRFNRSFN